MIDERQPDGAASYEVIADIHRYTAEMLRNRARECAESGEWDPSVISNSLKLLSSEGVRAKVTASPLASIDSNVLEDLEDLNFSDYRYGVPPEAGGSAEEGA